MMPETHLPTHRDALLEWVQCEPTNPDAWASLARVLFATNELSEADRASRKGMEGCGASAPLLCVIGETLLATRRPAEAARVFDAAIHIDPLSPIPRAGQIKALLAQNEGQNAAEAALEKARTLTNATCGRAPHLLLLCEALERNGLNDEALAVVEQAILLRPDQPQAHRIKARLMALRGDLDGARDADAKGTRVAALGLEGHGLDVEAAALEDQLCELSRQAAVGGNTPIIQYRLARIFEAQSRHFMAMAASHYAAAQSMGLKQQGGAGVARAADALQSTAGKTEALALAVYLVSKLSTGSVEAACDLAEQLNLDTLSAGSDVAAAEPADSNGIAEAATAAVAAFARNDFPAAVAHVRNALAGYARIAENGDTKQALRIVDSLADWLGRRPIKGSDLLALASSGVRFHQTGQRSEHGAAAKIGAHQKTDGRVNDFFGWTSGVRRPTVPVADSAGILGMNQPDKLDTALNNLRAHGYHVFDAKLDADVVARCRAFAMKTRVWGISGSNPVNRERYISFDPDTKEYDGYYMNKHDVIAQPDVQKLMADPSFLTVAQNYFGCDPVMTEAEMWWSMPTNIDNNTHMAQQYHFDMEWWRFIKFFFYLSDVDAGGGPHVYVRKSHIAGNKPAEMLQSPYERMSDERIAATYPGEDIVTLTAPAGSIIVGDTRCWHKGLHPTTHPRLLMVFEFANSMMHGAVYPQWRIPADADPALRAYAQAHPGVFRGFDLVAQ